MTVEYRVVWQRETQRRRAVLYQRPEAAERKVRQLLGQIDPWEGQDLDEVECCSGRECGCRGVTKRQVREEWLSKYDSVPPFVLEPRIEAREVGEWADAAASGSREVHDA